MGGHGAGQAVHGALAGIARVRRAGKAAHGAGQTVQGGGEIGGRTAVDAKAGRGFFRHLFRHGTDGALDRVIHPDILGPCPQMPRQRQKTRMFARTVVVTLAGFFMGQHQAVMFRRVIGPVRPAAQVGLGQAQPGEPARHHAGMQGRALVAGAGQGQLRLRQSGGIGGPAFDQGQGLDHLAGGARKDHCRRIPPGLDHLARGIADHRMAGMGAFQQPAAPEFDHRKRPLAACHFTLILTPARFCAHGAFTLCQFCGMGRISS